MSQKLRIQTHNWFNILIKCTVGLILRGKYDLHGENTEILADLKPPYVLLPTHANLRDPFFLNYFVHHPIFFVTSDSLFRNQFISYWIRQFGCIPKSQAIPDIETIRNIMTVIKKGHVLCIYPEGMQTWDGTTLPFLPSTARLLKLLRVPVVRVISHGAFSTCPRWSRTARQGRVTLDFKLILSAEDIRKNDQTMIDSVIRRELAYNEWDWLSHSRRYYNNFFGAQGMEKALYACPSCGSLGTMRGSLNIVHCTACDFLARFTNKGRFVSHRFPAVPADLHQWNVFQKNHLRNVILERLSTGVTHNEPIFFNNVTAFTGYRVNPMKRCGKGSLVLRSRGVFFFSDDLLTPDLEFPVERIEGVTFLRKYIEFYFEKTLYRFRFLSKYGSSLKWSDAIGILREECRAEEDPEPQTGESLIPATERAF